MGKKNRCRFHPSSRKTFWPTSHSDFLSCRIPESECKFTGPNKNKINFTCLLLYQFATILSQTYQAFPAVVAFKPRATNFPFLVLVMEINCIYIFWTLFVKTSLLWSKHFVEFFFYINKAKYYLNSQRNKNI